MGQSMGKPLNTKKNWFGLCITLFLFTFFCLLSLCGFYFYKKRSLLASYQKNLKTLASKRAHEIVSFFDKQTKLVQNIANQKIIKDFLKEKQNQQQVRQAVSAYQPEGTLKNILLISLNGDIIFTDKPSAYAKANLTKEPYSDSSLAQSYQLALTSIVPDISTFKVDPIKKEASLYITVPVIDKHKLIGFVSGDINEKKIFKIVHNYHGLGKTGENVLAQKREDRAEIIAPTRLNPNIPFKEQAFFKKVPGPMQKAILGKFGSGIGTDYLDYKVIAAWHYISKADWGLVVKIEYHEVIAKLNFLFWFIILFLVLNFLFFCLLFGFFRSELFLLLGSLTGIKRLENKILQSQFIRYILWGGFILSCILLLLSIIDWQQENKDILQNLKDISTAKVESAAEKINKKFDLIERIADALSQDLSEGRLKKEDIPARIERDIKENNDIWSITIAYEPFQFKEEQKLYAPSVQRTKQGPVKKENLALDYTIQKDNWYHKALQKGQWFDPAYGPKSDLFFAHYGLPFFDKNKKPVGVISLKIALNFALEKKPITEIAKELVVGKSGYGLIFSNKGTLVYHPIAQNVLEQKTINDLAREQGIPEIEDIAKKVLAGKSGLAKIYSSYDKQDLWITYRPIKVPGWAIGIIFDEDEIKLPVLEERHNFILVLLSLLFALFILSLLFVRIERPTVDKFVRLSIICTALLACAIVAFWYFILISPSVTKAKGIPIETPIGLQTYIDDARKIARELQEPKPIVIPTGIYIFNLHFPNLDHVDFTGYIWQTYGPEQESISKEFIIPQATNVTKTKILDQKEGDNHVLVWKVSARLPRIHNYAQFPYDSATISVPIESKDITKNILLVPDLSTYFDFDPALVPGVDKDFSLSGFNIKKSYFSIETTKPSSSFGSKSLKKIYQVHKLDFNIIITRNILNPLIVYLLPLLVILFSLFTVYFMCTKLSLVDPVTKSTIFGALGSYSGLFFALVILHRTLRSSHPTGAILFIEYLFLFTYVTIVILFFHGLLIYVKPFADKTIMKISETLKLLFWPSQLLLWLLASIWVFY